MIEGGGATGFVGCHVLVPLKTVVKESIQNAKLSNFYESDGGNSYPIV